MASLGRSGVRGGPMAANAFAPRSGVAFAGRGFRDRDGGFRDRDRGFHRGRGFALFGAGFYGPYGYDDYYDYPDYAYDDSYYSYYDNPYYGDSGCYVVRQRVHTRYGWRLQPVQVCS